jgi:hypothetical protein
MSGSDMCFTNGPAVLPTSPRLQGEVGAQRRVRGTFREPEPVESPPHPNPLPAGGEREKHAILAA